MDFWIPNSPRGGLAHIRTDLAPTDLPPADLRLSRRSPEHGLRDK